MADITLGDYEIDDDSNGDLIIKDPNDNIVFRWDEGNGEWNLEQQDITNLNSVSTDEAHPTHLYGRGLVQTRETTRQKYRSVGYQFDGFNTISDWIITSGSGTLSAENSDTYFGPQALRLSPADGTTEVTIKRSLSVFQDWQDQCLSFAAKDFNSGSLGLEINLTLTSGNSWTAFHRLGGDMEGWEHVDIGKYLGSSSLADLADVEEIIIRVYSMVDSNDVLLDDFRLTPRPTRGYTMIGFDDAYSSVYDNAFPVLSEYGLTGYIAVAEDLVGTSNHMTWDQLREMHEAGWDIIGQTSTHPHLPDLSESEIRTEFETNKEALQQNGLVGAEDILVYPYGEFDQLTIDVASEYHRLGYKSQPDPRYVTGPVPTDTMTVTRGSAVNKATETEAAIDRAADFNVLAHWYVHRVGSGEDLTVSELDSICQKISNREDGGSLECIVPSQHLSMLQNWTAV